MCPLFLDRVSTPVRLVLLLGAKSPTAKVALRRRPLVVLPARPQRQLYLRYPASVQQGRATKHSAIGSWTLAVACVVTIFSAVLLEELSRPSSSVHLVPRKHTFSAELPTSEDDSPKDIMAGNVASGRPGTLTAEQEEKLKEMWKIMFKIFGVQKLHNLDDNQSNGATNGDAGSPSESTSTIPPEKTPSEPPVTPEKKRKSRLGFLHRGRKESESSPAPNSPPPVDGIFDSMDGANDKYDQNKQFRETIASQSPESLRSAFWSMLKHDHPDALLLRFLRARKWDVHAAVIMAISNIHWRDQEFHVDDDIMLRGEEGCLLDSQSKAEGANNSNKEKDGQDFLMQYRMGKSFLHGLDREGRPLCVVRVRLHHGGDQTVTSLERYTVHTIETARLMLRGNVDTATLIFDMTDFSLANMVRLRGSDLRRSILIILTGLYPGQVYDQVF